MVLGVRIEGAQECCQTVFSSKYATLHSIKPDGSVKQMAGTGCSYF